MPSQVVTVYWSPQCPNCVRFLKSAERLGVTCNAIDVSATRVSGLSAVPTVVTSNGETRVGTDAFEWLRGFEQSMPLTSYAMVMGEGAGGLTYTDLESDEPVAATPFGEF
jgi:glutaredoxin